MNRFSERLRELRVERKLTQRALGEKLGISHISIANFELGGQTDFNTLIKIAKFFGVSTDYLLGVADV